MESFNFNMLNVSVSGPEVHSRVGEITGMIDKLVTDTPQVVVYGVDMSMGLDEVTLKENPERDVVGVTVTLKLTLISADEVKNT